MHGKLASLKRGSSQKILSQLRQIGCPKQAQKINTALLLNEVSEKSREIETKFPKVSPKFHRVLQGAAQRGAQFYLSLFYLKSFAPP